MVVVTAGTGGAHKVLLISGKQSRSISVMIPNQASSDSDSTVSGAPLRKRQRLTHLSPEEKALRRKLKNRVAAQTARDRKKAKMGELEQQVLELELENQKLHVENRLLLEKTSDLLCENEELRQRLGLDTLEEKEKVQVLESVVSNLGLVTGSSESAALRLRVPPQQVQAQQSPNLKTSPWILTALTLQTLRCKILQFWGFRGVIDHYAENINDPGPQNQSRSDLLLGILDILDPELFLKTELPEAQEPQPELVLDGGPGEQVPASPSAALGPAPVKLEALNELIHFDHIYTKPAEVVSEESICDVKSEDSVAFSEVEVEIQAVSVKDEPEEVVIPALDRTPDAIDDFFSDASSYEKASNLTDVYSDSGYERSPSPFSNISSPLCSEGSWDDMFATELFPQLISV